MKGMNGANRRVLVMDLAFVHSWDLLLSVICECHIKAPTMYVPMDIGWKVDFVGPVYNRHAILVSLKGSECNPNAIEAEGSRRIDRSRSCSVDVCEER